MRYYLTLCALLPSVLCAYTNTTLQLVASSGVSTSASYTAKGAVPTTGGTATQSSSYTHYSGDAAAYILKPDSQRSGVAYEWLADNDADGLSDSIEAGLGSDLYAPDTDEDGLTDAEEYLIHGTSLFDADTDHDGSLDPDELIAGTSPLDAGSRFEARLQPAANGRLSLEWFGVVGRSYIIESAITPAGPWSDYSPFAFPGSDTLLSIEFSSSETVQKAFYRVTIE
jgi:hypothetical protein